MSKKHYTCTRKSIQSVCNSIKNYKSWLFTNDDCSQFEILTPTLDNLMLMREFNLTKAVKGFSSPSSYARLRKLCMKYDIYSASFVCMCIGAEDMSYAISDLMNGITPRAIHPVDTMKIIKSSEQEKSIGKQDLLQKKILYLSTLIKNYIGKHNLDNIVYEA